MMRIATVREPTQGQLLAMAHVDGELTELSRRKFEDVIRRDPALMREVAELKALDLLFRQVVSADPVGFEWEAVSVRHESHQHRRL